MSKMIRVESCGGCDHESESDKLCLELIRRSKGTWKIAAKAAFIIDETKILPNCPLEDFPECCVCPTCNGEKEIPNGLHSQTLSEWEDSSDTFEKCKTCKGAGTIQERYHKREDTGEE